MKTIIQSRKTRSFTYRQLWRSFAELSSFLMCFSLPDSNSFPGPRRSILIGQGGKAKAVLLRTSGAATTNSIQTLKFALLLSISYSCSISLSLSFISHLTLPFFCLCVQVFPSFPRCMFLTTLHLEPSFISPSCVCAVGGA